MAIDVKNIGMFGVSFSRGMEQTWLVLERRKQDFRVAFFQNFDTEGDQDDDVFNEYSRISFELGEQIIAAAFENAHLEDWQSQYIGSDDGPASDLNWTIDVDDNSGADLMLLSGNWKLPPNDLMTPVIEAMRLCEDRFMRCVKDLTAHDHLEQIRAKEKSHTAIDAKNVGMFGVSFSRGMDQTWVVLARYEHDFIVEFFQNFETDSDEDDEVYYEDTHISFELGEQIIAAALENAHLEDWQIQYTENDDGPVTDLNWTIDVDDNSEADLLLLSGNWKLPPNDWMTSVIEAIRLYEDRFMRCVKEWE